ncbi:hypothetical protein ACFL4T_08965 [candidate division KSB1 bacterium]
MTELLSQKEIDELLSSVTYDEDENKPVVKIYDFKNPFYASTKDSEFLVNIFESFTKEFAGSLKLKTGYSISSTFKNVTVVNIRQFFYNLTNPFSNAYVFSSQDSEDNMVISLPIVLIPSQLKQFEKMNETLKILIKEMGHYLMESLLKKNEIFKEFNLKLIEYKIKLKSLNEISMKSKACFLLTFNFIINGHFYPFKIIFPMSWYFKMFKYYDYDYDINKDSISMLSHMLSNKLDVSAVLNEHKISLKNFLQLDEGDIVFPKKSFFENICVDINRTAKFSGAAEKPLDYNSIIIKDIKKPRINTDTHR